MVARNRAADAKILCAIVSVTKPQKSFEPVNACVSRRTQSNTSDKDADHLRRNVTYAAGRMRSRLNTIISSKSGCWRKGQGKYCPALGCILTAA